MKLVRTDIGRVVARRILSERGNSRKKVVVSIGLPRRDPRSKYRDWECPFLIEGVGKPEVQKGFGVDSMQALILAIQGIRVTLEQTGRVLFFLDPEFGVDIPLIVPSWGKEFEERVRLATERETVRVWRAKIKARKEKIRAEEAELKRQGSVPRKIAKELAETKKHLEEWQADLNKLKPGWSIPETPVRRKRR